MSEDKKNPQMDIADLPSDLRFNADGLIPAIAQQFDTGEVLMMAWMNAQSLAKTLQDGRVVYWSRSRQSLWRKGDTSGHTQRLMSCHFDCDGDTLLLLVDQKGAACHEGTRTCFTHQIEKDGKCARNDTLAPIGRGINPA